MSLAAVVDLLRCPHCRQPLDLLDGSARCPHGHSFDLARQGYLNLLTRPAPRNADSPAMIAARDRFLGAGHFAPIADRLAGLASQLITATPPGERPAIAEPGAGTGYYLARVLDALPAARGLATDISAYAARRAARAHDRLGAVVADTWAGLPVGDGLVDLIMIVFAPRNAAEFARMLRPAGRLLVAAAGPDHLADIRGPLGLLDVQPDKQQRIADSLAAHFATEHHERLEFTLRPDRAGLTDLVAMGPNAHHRAADLEDRIAALGDRVEVSCQVEVSVFVRR